MGLARKRLKGDGRNDKVSRVEREHIPEIEFGDTDVRESGRMQACNFLRHTRRGHVPEKYDAVFLNEKLLRRENISSVVIP